MLFVTGDPSALTLTLIAFGNGIGAALGFPAYQAMLPDLVPVEDLPGAIALSSAQYNLGRVVGPALAGIVIAIGGYAWAEGVNAVSFLAVVAVLLTLHASAAAAAGPRRADPAVDHRRLPLRPARARAAHHRARDVPQHVPRRAVHRARCRRWRRRCCDAGKSGTSVLVTAQGAGAVLMAFSLGLAGRAVHAPAGCS